MDSLNNLLNKISDFKCEVDGKEIVFPGILQEENGNVILNAKFPLEQYRKIGIEAEMIVLGEVCGGKVTLMGCHITTVSSVIGNSDISIYAVPNEIIIGECFSTMPVAKKIIVSTPDLNYMFEGASLLEFNCGFTKENPSVLNYTFPESINAVDKYGEINLYQTFNVQWSVNAYTHSITSVIEYSFIKPMPLMDAVAKVSAARSLFSFFANGYIPFGDIFFEDDTREAQYVLYLNYKDNVPAVNEPFFITTSMFGDQFQKVWGFWLNLYESASPVPTLFYEIVCNRSTRINYFLNLSQAIEVYSNIYRNAEASAIAKSDQNNTRKSTKLKHRYQDILAAYNNTLKLSESNIENYAQGFANMRNYYTHYNSGKYIEPSYDELFSAIHILRFVLLTIVYSSVGISVDNILECKKKTIFTKFDMDARRVLNYSKKKPELSAFNISRGDIQEILK